MAPVPHTVGIPVRAGSAGSLPFLLFLRKVLFHRACFMKSATKSYTTLGPAFQEPCEHTLPSALVLGENVRRWQRPLLEHFRHACTRSSDSQHVHSSPQLSSQGDTCPHGFAAGNPHGNPHWLNLHACSCLSLELHTRGSADLGSWEKPYPRGSIAHFPGMDSLQ